MDIVCVHDGLEGVALLLRFRFGRLLVFPGLFRKAAALAAQHQPLGLGQLFARAPLGRLERDMPVGLLDLLFGCPPGRSVLAIAHGLGLDVVQGALTGEVCGGGHDQEHPARQRKK